MRCMHGATDVAAPANDRNRPTYAWFMLAAGSIATLSAVVLQTFASQTVCQKLGRILVFPDDLAGSHLFMSYGHSRDSQVSL